MSTAALTNPNERDLPWSSDTHPTEATPHTVTVSTCENLTFCLYKSHSTAQYIDQFSTDSQGLLALCDLRLFVSCYPGSGVKPATSGAGSETPFTQAVEVQLQLCPTESPRRAEGGRRGREGGEGRRERGCVLMCVYIDLFICCSHSSSSTEGSTNKPRSTTV